MSQKATFHYTDRNRYRFCDSSVVTSKHSLFGFRCQEHRNQQRYSQSSPEQSLPGSHSFGFQITFGPDGCLHQIQTQRITPSSYSSPVAELPTEETISTPEDSGISSVNTSKQAAHHPSPSEISEEDCSQRLDVKLSVKFPSPAPKNPFCRRYREFADKIKTKMPSFPEQLRRRQQARVSEMDSGANLQELPLCRESPVELQYDPRPAELAGVNTISCAELPSHPQPSRLEPPDQYQSPTTTKKSVEAGDLFREERLGAPSFDNPSPYRPNYSTSVQGPMTEISPDDISFHSDLIHFMHSPMFPRANDVYEPVPLCGIADHGIRQNGQPTLTLNTGIQGRYLSSQESRRPSLQESTPSQYSGTTLPSGSLSSAQSFFSTQLSSHASSWPISSSRSFRHAADFWQPQHSAHPQDKNNLVYSSAWPGSSTSRFPDLFTNSFHFPENSVFDMELSQDPKISIFPPEPPLSAPPVQPGLAFPIPLPLNPKVPPASAPPTQTQHHPPPRDEVGHPSTPNLPVSPVPKDVCPKCRLRFTSKPRDLGRNLKRHLTLSCPRRETLAPRLECSSTRCNKTFARDCARRTHEKNYHTDEGLPRPRGWGRGVEKGRGMKRAISSLN